MGCNIMLQEPTSNIIIKILPTCHHFFTWQGKRRFFIFFGTSPTPATRQTFLEFFTSIGAAPVDYKRLQLAALIRLVIIVPAVFVHTFIGFINVDSHNPPVQNMVITIWGLFALLYILSNVIIYFKPHVRTNLIKSLSYFSVFLELITNQLVLYSFGSLIYPATLYIVLIVAVYRVFLDYRFSLFAALWGGVLYSIFALLEVTGVIPLSPGLPNPVVHYFYSGDTFFPATAIILAVIIGIAIAFLSINYGINQSIKFHRRLQEQSFLDGLTNIANRRRFDECIEAEWKRARRNLKPVSLIMLDIDAFKLYNDNYGHQAGDDCLKKIAHALKLTLKRSTDLVARYGGEEFAVILPETEKEGAALVAEELRTRVEALNIPHAFSPFSDRVTISLGVAIMVPGDDTLSFSTLIEQADMALYGAKEKGRNQVNEYVIPVHTR